MFLKTTSKQTRMELPLVVSTSSLSECPVLKKKRVPQYHLKKSTCVWLKLQSPMRHTFHTTAHKCGENMGLRQSAGVPNVFSATTRPTFDQPHSVEWCWFPSEKWELCKFPKATSAQDLQDHSKDHTGNLLAASFSLTGCRWLCVFRWICLAKAFPSWKKKGSTLMRCSDHGNTMQVFKVVRTLTSSICIADVSFRARVWVVTLSRSTNVTPTPFMCGHSMINWHVLCLCPVRFVRGLRHRDDVSSKWQGRSSPQQCQCDCGRSVLAARKHQSWCTTIGSSRAQKACAKTTMWKKVCLFLRGCGSLSNFAPQQMFSRGGTRWVGGCRAVEGDSDTKEDLKRARSKGFLKGGMEYMNGKCKSNGQGWIWPPTHRRECRHSWCEVVLSWCGVIVNGSPCWESYITCHRDSFDQRVTPTQNSPKLGANVSSQTALPERRVSTRVCCLKHGHTACSSKLQQHPVSHVNKSGDGDRAGRKFILRHWWISVILRIRS